MTERRRLPPGFEALESLAQRWAVSDSNERMQVRWASDAAERQQFYDSTTPLLETALVYLDGRRGSRMSAEDTCLLDLILTLAHIALAVELQKDVEPRHARAHSRFSFDRAPAEMYGPGASPSATS